MGFSVAGVAYIGVTNMVSARVRCETRLMWRYGENMRRQIRGFERLNIGVPNMGFSVGTLAGLWVSV